MSSISIVFRLRGSAPALMRLAFGDFQRCSNGFVAREVAEDLVGLAADPGDRGTDSIGAIAEGRPG